MNELTNPRHIWSYRAFFLLLCLGIIILKLLPLGLDRTGWPGPDLLLALTIAWLVRQPAVVPLPMIVGVFLLADFLLHRPPGLWTIFVILASESLRHRRLTMTEFPFLVEWTAFAVAVFAMIVANRIVLWVLLVDLSPLGYNLAHGIVTVAVYPLVVLVSKFVFGLRRMGPVEADTL